MSVVNFVSRGAVVGRVRHDLQIPADKASAWREVAVARSHALLFTIGKSLIGLYIGSSKAAESYGTAGLLIVILLWIYYSITFLLAPNLHTPMPSASAVMPPRPKRRWRGPPLLGAGPSCYRNLVPLSPQPDAGADRVSHTATPLPRL